MRTPRKPANLRVTIQMFMISIMRSIRDPGDLTTRARIRDAAVDLIGRDGFARVTVRQVAQAAGVSPGLVIHHFGSKEGLRQECDTYVQHVLTESIADLESYGPSSAMAALARAEEYLPAVRYGSRALRDGGPLAQTLFDQLVGGTERWLRSSIDAGEVRPPADPKAMATVLVCVSLGVQLLEPYLAPDIPPERRAGAVVDSIAGAAVELYTHGIFATTEYLDAFRQRGEGTPGGPPPTRAERPAGSPRRHGDPSRSGNNTP